MTNPRHNKRQLCLMLCYVLCLSCHMSSVSLSSVCLSMVSYGAISMGRLKVSILCKKYTPCVYEKNFASPWRQKKILGGTLKMFAKYQTAWLSRLTNRFQHQLFCIYPKMGWDNEMPQLVNLEQTTSILNYNSEWIAIFSTIHYGEIGR